MIGNGKEATNSIHETEANRESEEKEEGGQKSQAKQVVKLAEDTEAIFFRDQFNVPYIAPFGNGKQILRLTSKPARLWISRLVWEKFKIALNTNLLQSVLNVLQAKALFDGPTCPLHLRTAILDEAIWYDLGGGRAVRITSKGWEIIQNPSILFRSLDHQKVQVAPVAGGNLEELLGFFNLKEGPNGGLSDEQLLVLCFVVCGLIPGFPHPALVLHGAQGSKKSTLCKLIKELLDPSSLEDAAPPDSMREFVQLASHHWFFPLDNLSKLPDWMSDSICRVITGSGLSKRELYTDDEDIIYNYRHLIAINGINLTVEKADLLDRSLLIQLQRTDYFETEKVFWNRFNEKKPLILGAMFDTLAKALSLFEKVEAPTNTRMADFTKWGCVVAKALGYSETDFLNAYQGNISRQHDEAIEASPVAQALIRFVESNADWETEAWDAEKCYGWKSENEWEGTPTALLRTLEEKVVDDLRITTKMDKKWPKRSNWLWKRINEVLPDLEAKGLKIAEKRGKARNINIQKIADNADGAEESKSDTQLQADSNDGNDGISPEKVSPSKLKPSGNHKKTIEEAVDIFTKPLD